MRTASAPTTALSGKSMSEDSLATSTAILAAPYAVLQPDSLGDSGSQDEEHMDMAIELDEATSAAGFFALKWALTTSFLTRLVSAGERSVGLADGGFLRKWSIVGPRTACQALQACLCAETPLDAR